MTLLKVMLRVSRQVLGFGLVWEVFSPLSGCVRDEFISGGSSEPDLRNLLPLLRAEMWQWGWKGSIICKPVDVVDGQNGLVMTILVGHALV